MRNLAVIGLVLLIVVVLLLYLISFQVRQTDYALVMRFGRPVREITEPGWHWKLPDPIETRVIYDARPRIFEGVVEEMPTKGGDPIVVTTYCVWKVDSPEKFRQAVRDVANAEKLLRSQLRDAQNKVIGRHAFNEFVNTDPGRIQFSQIESEMTAALAGSAKENYGIEVLAVGIKKLGVSEDVTKDVFDRMKADRQRRTDTTIAQGKAEATRIRTGADAQRKELLAAAQARAKRTMGEGDAEAAGYYKMLEQDPQFAMFLREIDSLKNILKDRATVVLPADSDPFKLLRQQPKMEPKK